MAEREVSSNAKGAVLPSPSPAPVRRELRPTRVQTLRQQQAWLQNVVTCVPGQLDQAMSDTQEFIKEGYGLDPESRLWIYRGMFPIRMVESLQVDFPGVAYALGSEAFEELVMNYVAEHPSSSWTLNHLGQHFPAYLSQLKSRQRIFLHDLAVLEWNLAQVFDEPEVPALTPDRLQTLSPDQWEELVLKPRPTSRLLKFAYPVSHYLHQVDNELTPRRPNKATQRVLILRKGYQMNRVILPEGGYFILKQLFAGKKLAKAINQLVTRYPEVGPTDLQRWFHQWGDWGIFQA